MKKLFLLASIVSMFFLATTASAATIFYEDFEGDTSVWEIFGDVQFVNTAASHYGMSGTYAQLGRYTAEDYAGIGRGFYIPEGTTQLIVSFDYAFYKVASSNGTPQGGVGDETDPDYSLGSLSVRGFDDDNGEEKWIHWAVTDTGYLFDWNSDTGEFSTVYHFEGILDIAELLDVNPNGQIAFLLTDLFNDVNTKMVIDNILVATAPVPEPATMFLLGTGLLGLAVVSRKKLIRKK